METPTISAFTTLEADTPVAELLALLARERASHLRRWCRQEMSLIQLHALLALEAHGPLAMSRLADIMDVALSNATGIVTRMEERGLLRRTHDEVDRRIVFVTLTDLGRQAAEDRQFMRAGHLRQVLEAMSDHERSDFVGAMRSFLGTAERLRAAGSLVDDEPDRSLRPAAAAPIARPAAAASIDQTHTYSGEDFS